MPTIGFGDGKSGTPIAIVKGGDQDGQILTVYTEEDAQPKRGKKDHEVEAIRYTKDLKGMKPSERVAIFNRLSEAKARSVPPNMLVENEGIRRLYARILSESDAKDKKTITLPEILYSTGSVRGL